MTLEHAAVREALIKSTLALMQEGGLAAVKARTVADQAGVSVGTVYNLFGNVDQLILAANLKIYEDLGALGYPIGWQEIVDSPVPVIAAVNGPAVTGGFALAVNTDFTIASERASFCDNELLVIGYGNKQLMASLQRRVGDAWTRELSLTSEYIDAATALRIGLVNHVVPHEELMPRALAAAQAIAAKDRRAVSAMRQQWDEQQGLSLRTARNLHDSFHAPFKDAVTAFADEDRVKQLMSRTSGRSRE